VIDFDSRMIFLSCLVLLLISILSHPFIAVNYYSRFSGKNIVLLDIICFLLNPYLHRHCFFCKLLLIQTW